MKMPDKITKQLEAIKCTIGNSVEKTGEEEMKDLAPSGMGWLRAGVASIPFVGGALDHLLFDKYAEIQQKNMQQVINSIKEKMASMEEHKVSRDWFESEEALDMLRKLFQQIMYDGDSIKIKTLSNVYCQFGTIEHKEDPNKYAVLDTISKLSNNQRIVFKAVNEMPSETKTVSVGAIEYTAMAKWQSAILDYCNKRSLLRGQVLLDVELDILTSFNLLVNLNLGAEDAAFRVSALGKLAYSYLKET